MYFCSLILGFAVLAFASACHAQTSPGSYYAQQKIRLELLEKQGKITPAQRQAMELKLLQQLSGGGSGAGRGNGPKTGVYPNPQAQGNMLQGNANTAAAQQAAARAQAEKSREALKRKADGKKAKKKGGKADDNADGEKKDDAKKEDAKKGKKN